MNNIKSVSSLAQQMGLRMIQTVLDRKGFKHMQAIGLAYDGSTIQVRHRDNNTIGYIQVNTILEG